MRTSNRDPNNIEPKIVIVPDSSAAEYLNGLFAGSQIEKLETDILDVVEPKRKKPQSGKDRKAKYRQRQKQKLLNELFN
jgi:hypothetical protein